MEENMVHLRSKKFRGASGKDRIYYYLVKDVYKNGKKLQKVVMYIGTANKLFEKLKQIKQQSKNNR